MIYRCDNCGHESTKFFGLCPKCKEGAGIATEEIDLGGYSSSGKSSGPIKLDIRRVDKNVEEEKSSRSSGFKSFDSVLSSAKGFLDSQVVLLGASPGVGKSTLCSTLAREDTLYISSEENYKQVNARMLRVNPNSNCEILSTTKIDTVLEAIKTTKSKLIIIDSINSIEFGVGYATTAKFADQITELIKQTNKIAIIISQVARNGEITGMNSLIHVVDTVLHLERSEISSNIIATSSKNRFGEIGEVAIFQHKSDGFVEIESDETSSINNPSEPGLTYTKTRFGHKNMMISIESLVSSSQGSFGLRKANGYNQNRLIQLIGILSYYGKIDLTSKDIYVAIGNGLYTDDIGIELAMANSILSSYYGFSLFKQAYGEIKLNGKLTNGPYLIDDDNNEIKIDHVKNLIDFYKRELKNNRNNNDNDY